MKKIIFIVILSVFILNFNISAFSTECSMVITEKNKTLTSENYTAYFIKENGDLYVWGDILREKLWSEHDENIINHPVKISSDILDITSLESTVVFAIDNNETLFSIRFDDNAEICVQDKIMEDVSMASIILGGMYRILKNDGSLWLWGCYVLGYRNDEFGDEECVTFEPDTPRKAMEGVKYINSYLIKKYDGSWWSLRTSIDNLDYQNYQKYIDNYDMEKAECPYVPVKDEEYTGYENSKYTGGAGSIDKNDRLWVDGKKIMDNAAFVCSQNYREIYAAIKTNGELWTWGDNQYGQLGDGTTISRKIPRKVMDDVVLATCTNSCILALKSDGTLWKMGYSKSLNLECEIGMKKEEYYLPHKIEDNVMVPTVRKRFENGWFDESEKTVSDFENTSFETKGSLFDAENKSEILTNSYEKLKLLKLILSLIKKML